MIRSVNFLYQCEPTLLSQFVHLLLWHKRGNATVLAPMGNQTTFSLQLYQVYDAFLDGSSWIFPTSRIPPIIKVFYLIMQYEKQRGIGFTVSVSDASLAFATPTASKKSTDAKPKHGFNQVLIPMLIRQFNLLCINSLSALSIFALLY